MTKPIRGAAPVLSIVVPAPGDVAALEETLVSVLENRPPAAEVVVALGCDYADPWNIAEEVRFVAAGPGAGLVDCINAGIAAATGRVIHLLAAGWRATEGWTEKPLEHFTRGDVAAVVPFVVADDDRDRVVAAGIRLTRGGRRIAIRGMNRGAAGDGRPMAPVLEAGFWSADLLAATAGFAKDCGDRLADADMAAAVACAGDEVVLEPASLIIGGPPRRRPAAFTAGMQAERLFWRALAAGPVVPALVAHGMEVLRHAVEVAPLGTLPMLAGRLAGLVPFGGHAARARQLAAIRSQTAMQATPTLRIDAAHDQPTRPQRPAVAAPLRRSA